MRPPKKKNSGNQVEQETLSLGAKQSSPPPCGTSSCHPERVRSHDRRLKRVARDALAHHVPGILRIMSRRGRLITDSYQARIFIRDITVYHRFLKTEELVFNVLKMSYLGYLLTG